MLKIFLKTRGSNHHHPVNQLSTALFFSSMSFYLCLIGCATLVRGTKDTLVIETDPPGAAVQLTSGEYGETPCSFKLSRKKKVTITIEKAGYEPVEIKINPKLSAPGSAAMAVNAFMIGGCIGAGVDVYTGAMNDLRPNPILIHLKKIADTSAKDKMTCPKALGE